MTSVFRTYIEMSQLLPQAIYTAALFFLPLQAVFFILGSFLIFTAWFARYLPKRL